jgi:hypothetical protein
MQQKEKYAPALTPLPLMLKVPAMSEWVAAALVRESTPACA